MYWAFYAVVLFASLAMMVREGLWSNTISLINIITSGLVAFGFYQPLVKYLDEEMTDGQHTYWLDFAVVWALFCATMIVCRVLTGAASKTRMRFKHPIDPVGGPVIGFFAAWVLAAFTLATLHLSPMPKEAFSGKLKAANVSSASIITSPDVAWLYFFTRLTSGNAYGSGNPANVDRNVKAFVENYELRRGKFEKAESLIVKRG